MEYTRPHLLTPDEGPQTAAGFNFSRSDFEDLIDNFTPFEDIPILLSVSKPDLDKFCTAIYNCNYKEAYDNLLRRAQLYYRKAMFSLSKNGNPTAIKVASEFYVGLGSVDKAENQVIFVNSMPEVPSDVENLASMQDEQAKQQQAPRAAFEDMKK